MDHALVAAHIQLANVRPNATRADIEHLIADCLDHRVRGVAVNPIWLPLARARLAGTTARLSTMLDFPMAGHSPASVASAAAEARSGGAHELEVMTKVGWLKSGMIREYREHLAEVVTAFEGGPVGALIELDQLRGDEVQRAVDAAAAAGIAFIVTSSGYGGGDATPAKVAGVLHVVAGRMRVKAAGGISSVDQAAALLAAGAHVVGVFDHVPAGLTVPRPAWKQQPSPPPPGFPGATTPHPPADDPAPPSRPDYPPPPPWDPPI